MARTRRCQSPLPRLDELPFRFFMLPRELRDNIYSLLSRDINIPILGKPFGDSLQIAIAKFPCLQPQLINHKFATEFREEMQRSNAQELFVSLTGSLPEMDVPPLLDDTHLLQHQLSNVKRMPIDLNGDILLACPGLPVNTSWQLTRSMVKFLLQRTPQLENASVKILASTAKLSYYTSYYPNALEGVSEASFRKALFGMRPSVEVKIRFILTEKLFSSWVRENSTLSERCQSWHQDHHPSNKVLWEGRFVSWPKGTWTWHGVELGLAPSGDGNTFEGVLEEIAEKENAKPGSLFVEWVDAISADRWMMG